MAESKDHHFQSAGDAFPVQPRMALAFFAASVCCWLTFSLVLTILSCFSADLLPSWLAPWDYSPCARLSMSLCWLFSGLQERPISKHVLISFKERITLVTGPHPFLFTAHGLCTERRENWTVQKLFWPFGQWNHQQEFNNIWSFTFSSVWEGRYGHKCALTKQTTRSVFMPFRVFQRIDSDFFTREWTEFSKETKESKHIHNWTQSLARQLWDSHWLIYWAAISLLRRSRRLSADNSRLIGIS